MNDSVELYSFGKNDRAGKVRWLANELGLNVTEMAVKFGEQRKPPYCELNPYGAVPTVKWQGKTLIESEAILIYMAEQFPEHKLVVSSEEVSRADYLIWLAICSSTLETKLVEYVLSCAGILPAEIQSLSKDTIELKIHALLKQLPSKGYLVASRFTIADISLAYCLRLAIVGKFITFEQVEHYLEPLMARPAAKQSEFFASLEK